MNEEDGKGSNEEKEGHNDLDNAGKDQNEGEEETGLDAADNNQEDSRKKKQPDIDEMKEPQVDEDHANPHHNELEEPPEPEEMNIEDNVNLDGEDRDEENRDENGENPFDIDEMKENMAKEEEEEQAEDGEGDKDKDGGDNDNNTDSSDDDEGDGEKDKNSPEEKVEEEVEGANEEATNEESRVEPEEEDKQKKDEEDEDKLEEEKKKPQDEDFAESKDKSSKQENVQSMPENDPEMGSKDQTDVTADPNDKNKPQPTADQDTGEDKDGVGQAENQDSATGHKGVADVKSADQEVKQQPDAQQKRDKSNKKGNTDEERTVAQNEESEKRLKTVDRREKEEGQDGEDEEDEDSAKQQKNVDEYQHVKEAKRSDETTLDNATEEQSKQVRHEKDRMEEEEKTPEDEEGNPNLMDVEEEKVDEVNDDEQLKSEKAEPTQKNKNNKKPSNESKLEEDANEEEEDKVLIDGEDVLTMDVRRGADTTAHCQMDVVKEVATSGEQESVLEAMAMKRKIDAEVQNRTFVNAQQDDFSTWQVVSAKMMGSARDLCEQLRLILEPTKCTRLRGDYRTGRRINMKKVSGWDGVLMAFKRVYLGHFYDLNVKLKIKQMHFFRIFAAFLDHSVFGVAVPQGQDLVAAHQAGEARLQDHHRHRRLQVDAPQQL